MIRKPIGNLIQSLPAPASRDISTSLCKTALLLLISITAAEARLNTERHYQDKFCTTGEKERILEDKTRVDCLTATRAIEVDFASKWYECVGQALHYARMTGLTPGCALIIETKADEKYWYRLKALTNHLHREYNLEIEAWMIRPD